MLEREKVGLKNEMGSDFKKACKLGQEIRNFTY